MTRRYCTNCGAELPEEARFCGSCGKPAHQTAAVATEGARVDVPPPPPQAAPVRGGGGAILKLVGLLTLIVVGFAVLVGLVLPFLVGFFQGFMGAL